MSRSNAVLVAAALMLATVARPLCGQQAPSDWPDIGARTPAALFVTETNGSETPGVLMRVTPTSLVLLVEGQERSFLQADIRQIQKRGDSKWNGAVIGALVGAAAALVSGECSDAGNCTVTPEFVISMSGFYALIGVGVDALFKGRTTIYSAQRP